MAHTLAKQGRAIQALVSLGRLPGLNYMPLSVRTVAVALSLTEDQAETLVSDLRNRKLIVLRAHHMGKRLNHEAEWFRVEPVATHATAGRS